MKDSEPVKKKPSKWEGVSVGTPFQEASYARELDNYVPLLAKAIGGAFLAYLAILAYLAEKMPFNLLVWIFVSGAVVLYGLSVFFLYIAVVSSLRMHVDENEGGMVYAGVLKRPPGSNHPLSDKTNAMFVSFMCWVLAVCSSYFSVVYCIQG
jgi:hypothetical protein